MDDEKRHSYRCSEVRVLSRALAVLRELAERGPGTVLQLSRRTGLPRTTLARLLETLCRERFVRRADSGAFEVCELLAGATRAAAAERRREALLRTTVDELGRQLGWPVVVCRREQASCVVVFCSDEASPLVADRWYEGARFPLGCHAFGWVLAATAGLDEPAATLVRERLAETRLRGYALAPPPHAASDRATLAVPVALGGVTWALGVRYSRTRLAPGEATRLLLPALRTAADRLACAEAAAQAPAAQDAAGAAAPRARVAVRSAAVRGVAPAAHAPPAGPGLAAGEAVGLLERAS